MPELYLKAGPTRRIDQANYNGYALPAQHPDRVMKEHDLIYFIQGEWEIGEEDVHYTAHAGDVLILTAGRHHYGVTPCAPGTNTMFLHIEALPEDAQDVPVHKRDSLLHISSHIRTMHSPTVRRCFERIIGAHSIGSDEMAEAYLTVLLYEHAQLSQGKSAFTLAEDIRALLLSSPNKLLHNDEIAEIFHVSQRTAENAFKKTYGMTIHQYMRSIKMDHACFYLRNHPDMTLSEIAHDLGFYDEFHLSRQFKRSFGISPTEYRKQLHA